MEGKKKSGIHNEHLAEALFSICAYMRVLLMQYSEYTCCD